MNGQPPPPPPPPAYYPPPRQGMGCFAKGCLTLVILGFLFIAVILGGSWYLYKKTFNNLTSAGRRCPARGADGGGDPEADATRGRLNDAIARNQATTVEFTGPELSSLLARESDFDFLRDKSRIDISNSIMTVTLSAPLDVLSWPGLKGRWFNGTLRFSMAYSDGTFRVDVKSAEANGHEFPNVFLSHFNSSFNESMNNSFHDELRKNDRGSEFWDHVKTISLEGDKLVLTTKPE